MREVFERFNLILSEKQLEQFEKYYDILIRTNKMFNITAITEREEVYKKHFIDSIIYNDLIKEGSLIDIGSGGGFPAVPLKIMNPNLNVTMMDATGKKCEFLKGVIDYLGLENIRVINSRAEEIAFDEKYREKFDFCTARAVARLNILAEYCIPFVKKGGYFVSYKGDFEEELKEAESAIKILGGEIKDIKSYQLDGAKRGLIYVEKVKNTPPLYPRSNGKIRKKPL